MGSYKKKGRAVKEQEKWNRFNWLKYHPEDKKIDQENIRVRHTGYANDDVRQLFAAVCLRACVDYKKATLGKKVDGWRPEDIIDQCHKFFGSEMFQYFVNRISVEEIERTIRATPNNAIRSIWIKHEKEQRPVVME